MEIVALVVGATGIAGRGVSQELLHAGARVHGLSRHREGIVPGVEHVAADLLDPASVGQGGERAEAEPRLSDRLVAPADRRGKHQGQRRDRPHACSTRSRRRRSVKHVALVTGLKHYLGPFEAYARSGLLPPTPVREEQPRLDVPELLLQPGRRSLRRGQARRLHLERASPAYDHRQGDRQRDEHGLDPRRLCLDLQGDSAGPSSSPAAPRNGTASPT